MAAVAHGPRRRPNRPFRGQPRSPTPRSAEDHERSPPPPRDARGARASNAPGSKEMLLLTAPALYARRVITENNRDLPRAGTPARALTELRWAWLLDGGGGWFSGQTEHARGAVGRRLREGG